MVIGSALPSSHEQEGTGEYHRSDPHLPRLPSRTNKGAKGRGGGGEEGRVGIIVIAGIHALSNAQQDFRLPQGTQSSETRSESGEEDDHVSPSPSPPPPSL